MVSAIVTLFVAPFLGLLQSPLPKEWNQPHGNAAGTAFVDCAPLASPPVERWRVKKGSVLAGPVVSQQKLFLVVRDEGKVELDALDPASGAAIAKATIPEAGEVFAVVAAEGRVAVFEPTAVHGFRLAAGKLDFDKSIAGAFGGEPTVVGSMLFASRGANGGVQWIDWTSGKSVVLAPKAFGRPAALEVDKFGEKVGPALVDVATDESGAKFMLQRFPILDSIRVKLGPAEAMVTSTQLARPPEAVRTTLVALQGKEGVQWCGWFGSPRGSGLLQPGGVKSLEFRDAPASREGKLYGFDQEERLVVYSAESGVVPIVTKADLGKGAQIGAPSIARDVLFLGNWAVDVGDRHVLWRLDQLQADGPLIPAGDELLVVKTKNGEVVGYGRKPEGPTTGGATTAAAAVPPGPNPPVQPGSKPGIVRSDGVFVPGKTTKLENGRWRLVPEQGAPQEYDAEAVALVDDGKEGKRLGEEMALFKACSVLPAARHAATLVKAFDLWNEAKQYDDCRRVLDEAKRYGLASAKVDELTNSIAGKASAKLAEKHPARKKCLDFETDEREEDAKDFTRAARWCAAHDAKVAATVLVTRAAEVSPKNPPDPDLVESWTPENFPADKADAGNKSWPAWAEALLPSGASFATLDESAQHRISLTKFATHALWLRTRNILLLSKETDPAVIGPLLARGEATVRALQKILGPSPNGGASVAPLEVRLHKTRADYLEDRIVGAGPPEWSAGCFSPSDGVSRFFSEVGDKQDQNHHELQHVFAHELTHHYVERRWINAGNTAASGGYWMVEGVAEFVSEQALEIGRLGERFDDTTVRSLDLASAVAAVDQLLPLDFLLSIDPRVFHSSQLEGGRAGPVRLKHTLEDAAFDKRMVFYCESSAFSFFVMNRCGEKGRAAYVNWLTKVYMGEPVAEPWKQLGFEDFAAMRKAFRAFLGTV